MDDSYGVWWNSNHALLSRTWKWDCHCGAPMDSAKCFYSSPMYSTFDKQCYYTAYCFWSWRTVIYIVMAHGALLQGPGPWGSSIPLGFCHIWVKLDHGLWRNRWNIVCYCTPPPHLLPSHGPNWATAGYVMDHFYSWLKNLSTHKITWLFHFWIWICLA